MFRWVQRFTPQLIDAARANVIDELIPAVFHNTGQDENNRCEADHGRLKSRLQPMRGLTTDGTASVVVCGHANIWNLRRGHDELGVETAPVFRLATAFDALQLAICLVSSPPTDQHDRRSRNPTVPAEMGHRYWPSPLPRGPARSCGVRSFLRCIASSWALATICCAKTAA